ncbi:hypothetical protein ACQUFY_09255 [Robbsia andropogonis]|uniref:hypothetical protein n=1 Tax=Robbsia andropogonis TaxID=28092 RepID=UPI003D2463E5
MRLEIQSKNCPRNRGKTSLFSSAVSKLSSLSAATKRLNALRDNLNSVISPIVNAVSTGQRTALDYIDYPSSFVSDISSGLSGLMDLRSFDVGTIMSDWSAALDQFSSVVQLPSSAATGKTVTIPGDTATSVSTTDVWSPSDPYIPGSALTTTPNATDVATVTALVQTAVATQLATTASAVLANEIDTPTLTPAQIEQIVGDVRQYIQDAIDTTRTNFTIDQSRPVTESLKDVAQAIETLGEAIVNTLPPLITRQVDTPCNLALLAFQWYGDYTRSDELLRLNPTLRNPNFINRGETLNAFAK